MKICKNGHEYDETARKRGDCGPCARESQRKWRKANPDANKIWRSENRGHIAAYKSKWQAENAERHAGHQHARRARTASSPSDGLTYRLAAECIVCGSADRLEIEHMVPLSRGGTDCINNKTTMCKSCNCSKHTMSILDPEFIPWYHRRRKGSPNGQTGNQDQGPEAGRGRRGCPSGGGWAGKQRIGRDYARKAHGNPHDALR